MKFSTTNYLGTSATVLAMLALSGCVIVPARPYTVVQSVPQAQPQVVYNTYPVYTQPPDGAVVYNNAPPPPAQVEVIPALPFYGAVFINGFWGWNSGRHHWVPGHYVRPVPGHRFVPQRWDNQGGRWALRGGFWVR